VKGRYRDNKVHGVRARNAEIFMFDTVKVKVKVKFSLQQATKTQRGSRGIALLFL
jgi:hypothetical protein